MKGGICLEKYVIDHMSDTTAYLETEEKKIIAVERLQLPSGITEGMVLFLQEERWFIDHSEKLVREKLVQDKLAGLFKRR